MDGKIKAARKYMLCLGLLVCFMLGISIPAYGESGQRTLRVAFPQVEGFSMTDDEGEHSGLIVDFLNEIAKYTDWEYDYIETDSEQMMNGMLNGEFDLVGGMYYLEDYKEFFSYPDYNCGYNKMFLITREGNHEIKSYEYKTFNDKTIGIFERASQNVGHLQEYLNGYGIDCTLKYYSSEELKVTGSLHRFLDSGEVDMLLGNITDVKDGYEIVASFDSRPHYIVVKAGEDELLNQMNKVFQNIYDADPEFAQRLYETYFGTIQRRKTELDEEEKEYAAKTKELKIAVLRDLHPLYCYHDNETRHGVILDVVKRIEKISGLKFSFTEYDTYMEALEAVKSGEADILGSFSNTDEYAKDQGLVATKYYGELAPIIVRNKESAYPRDGLVGAVLEGRNFHGTVEPEKMLYYDSIEEALADVNRGAVDFFYGASASVEYVVQKNNFNNIVAVNQGGVGVRTSFALPTPVDFPLFSILNKTINDISDEEKREIYNLNVLSIGISRFTLSELVYAHPFFTVMAVAAFLLLILTAVILFAKYRIHAVKMNNELVRAEEQSRAKSEFLSRMSHEIRTPMNAIVGLTNLTEMMGELPLQARSNLKKIRFSSEYLLSLINDILDMSRIESNKIVIAQEPFSISELVKGIEDMMESQAELRELDFRVEQKLRDDVLIGDAIRLRQVILNLLSNAFKFTEREGVVTLSVEEGGSTREEASFTVSVTDTGIGIDEQDQERIFKSFEQVGTNYAKSQGTGLGLSISGHIVSLMGGRLEVSSKLGVGTTFHFTVSLKKGTSDMLLLNPENPRTPADVSLDGIHILLAEDNDLNAEIVASVLEQSGAKVVRAVDGEETLDIFTKNQAGTFDAILMDIMMPKMDGLTAAQIIRQMKNPDGSEIPILALTANAFEEDKKRALDAGMNGFITKPINVDRLYAELLRVVDAKRT